MSHRDHAKALIAHPPKMTTNARGTWHHVCLWLNSEGRYVEDQSYTDETDCMKAMAQAFEDHALAIADLMSQAKTEMGPELTMEQVLELDCRWGM